MRVHQLQLEQRHEGHIEPQDMPLDVVPVVQAGRGPELENSLRQDSTFSSERSFDRGFKNGSGSSDGSIESKGEDARLWQVNSPLGKGDIGTIIDVYA